VRFELDAGGRRHHVEARRADRGWIVVVNGRAVTADVTKVGDRWSLLIGPPPDGVPAGSVAGEAADPELPRTYASYDVVIEARGAVDRTVHLDGRSLMVSFAGGLRPPSRRRPVHAATTANGPVEVESPMAGRVAKVLVEKGAAVAARQGLVIVEAMKMENELRAPRAGTVADVRVAEGASIDAGTVLVVIE
jgi:biotin carboxyl carrier protein